VDSITVISPVNNKPYCERPVTTDVELQRILAAAVTAQRDWSRCELTERIAICERMLAYFEANKDDMATELAWQMGRPVHQAVHEVRVMAERARYMMSIAETALAPVKIESSASCERYIQRDPLGVVLVVAPWNYPYLTAINSIVPALLSGNAVILKHSAQTPLCGERFAESLVAAGLPDGVFSSVILSHQQVNSLVQDDAVQYVTFTGSVSGGLHIQAAALKRFIPVGLELGGKDPAYVRHDAPLESTVDSLVDGAFFNSGQSCCGIERIYVHANSFDKFVELFVNKVQQYTLGNPLDTAVDLGPMVSSAAANMAREQVHAAVQQGATALVDQTCFDLSELPDSFMAPQVLIHVNHDMAIMKEESFAPIIGIMSVTDDEEALSLINDSEFGLTASIWTRDKLAALALGDNIHTGTFFLNRCDYLDPALAWTGVKNSGRGYSLSRLGFEQLTRAKSYHLQFI
jgi:acyl-CoA reductase-like NAD-dependent aldehyde dehydrogenase